MISYDLSPSDTASLHKKNVIAFATDIGGKTSHTAIMAKALEIPAAVGLKTVTKTVKNGDMVIVDGSNGIVIVNLGAAPKLSFIFKPSGGSLKQFYRSSTVRTA